MNLVKYIKREWKIIVIILFSIYLIKLLTTKEQFETQTFPFGVERRFRILNKPGKYMNMQGDDNVAQGDLGEESVFITEDAGDGNVWLKSKKFPGKFIRAFDNDRVKAGGGGNEEKLRFLFHDDGYVYFKSWRNRYIIAPRNDNDIKQAKDKTDRAYFIMEDPAKPILNTPQDITIGDLPSLTGDEVSVSDTLSIDNLPNLRVQENKSTQHRFSSCKEAQGKWMQYYDQQAVTCSDGYGISNLKFRRCGSGNNYRYEFDCVPFNTEYECHDQEGSCKNIDNEDTNHLKFMGMTCVRDGKKGVLRSFNMTRDGCASNEEKMKYRCCYAKNQRWENSVRDDHGNCTVYLQNRTLDYLRHHSAKCYYSNNAIHKLYPAHYIGCDSGRRRHWQQCMRIQD